MRNIGLVTKDLALSMDYSKIANENNWFIDNTYKPEDILKWITTHNEVALLWDEASIKVEDHLATFKEIRTNLAGPIIVIDEMKAKDKMKWFFELGVDDYIPFSDEFDEINLVLNQRINTYNQIYHQKKHDYRYINFGEYQIDLEKYKVTKAGQDLGLTPKELKLLHYLIKHKQQVLDRDQLQEGVWGDFGVMETSRMVDIHISHLRDKIEDNPKKPEWIKTKRGFGYFFNGEFTTK